MARRRLEQVVVAHPSASVVSAQSVEHSMLSAPQEDR